MGRSVSDLLAPEVILRTISQISLPGTSLQKIFGWKLGGIPNQSDEGDSNGFSESGNFDDYDARDGAYDVFDNTRLVATARVPGQPSHRIKPQKVGQVRYTLPRSAEAMQLDYEKIHNQRKIGGQSADLDRGGQRYIARQEKYLAQRYANMVELQTAGMIRGAYSFDQQGDKIYQRLDTSGEVSINYQIPANNKNQLNGNISAVWSNTGTDIPLDIFNVNAQSIEDTGMGIAHILVSSTIWNHVVNNTKVHTQGGSSNVVFDKLSRNEAGEFTAVLRSIPHITWHIIDYGLDVWNGTSEVWTRLIPTDVAVFIPEPSPEWASYIRGGEQVIEGPNGNSSFQYGFYPYAYPTWDPAGWMLNAVHNGFPALYVPKSIYYATVTGF